MKIPNKIKIGAIWYKIKYKDFKFRMYGCVNFKTCTIELSTEHSKQFLIGTLIHEIVEAIRAQYSLKMSHATLTTLCEALSPVMADLIKANRRSK